MKKEAEERAELHDRGKELKQTDLFARDEASERAGENPRGEKKKNFCPPKRNE